MQRRVIVRFDEEAQRSFEVTPAECDELGADEARAWLLEAFDELGCEPTNPMGKLLTVDLILGVARAAGLARFDSDAQWAQGFAIATACLRTAATLHVDVARCVLHEEAGGTS